MSYVSLHKNQLLDSLENQVLFADLTSVVIGQLGIGKTFFLEQLRTRLDGRVFISEIEADPMLTSVQLNKSICLQLGLGWQSSEQKLLDNIKSNIAQRVLITIDDAHLLSLDCLNYLLDLVESTQYKDDNLVYLLMAGEVSLARKLNETNALKKNANLCVVFELTEIEEEETKFLLADFEKIELAKLNKRFSEQKIDYFWQLCQGNPRELRNQLERWHQEAGKNSLNLIDENKNIKKYFLALIYSTIAIGLLMILVYQDEINQWVTPTAKVIVDDKNFKENKDFQSLEISKAEISKADTSEVEASQDEPSNLLTSENQDARKVKNISTEPREDTENQQDESLSLTQPTLQKNIETKPDTQQSSLLSTGKIVVEKKINKKLPDDDISSHASGDNRLYLSADEERLLKLADFQFTLQWTGLSSLSAAENYIQKHPLKDNMSIFRRNFSEKFLYIVISGEFNSHLDADNTRIIYGKRKYPGKPWVKSIKAVKKEIRDLR